LGVWAGVLGGEFGELFLEALPGGGVVKDFPGHVIDVVRDPVALCLCDLAEALALGEVAADDTVVALIASTLTTGIGVAVM